jgi:L-threonylcarbamoyladenylate synthase
MRIFAPDQIQEAAQLLKSGELVAFPTETVYGLGAPMFQPLAVAKVFETKGRPADNPLIVHLSNLDQLKRVAVDIPSDFYKLAEHFFPGPLTVVLKRHHSVPSIVSAGMSTIAFRMPSHPIAHALIDAVGEPLVGPSANLSGKPSSTTVEHVKEDFEGVIGGVIDGGSTQFGIESTVISLVSDVPVILRPGSVTQEAIEAVLQKPVRERTAMDAIIAPGMKHRHYAPRASVKLVMQEPEPHPKHLVVHNVSAETLYEILRRADREGYEEIFIICDQAILKDKALMDRLMHAAHG